MNSFGWFFISTFHSLDLTCISFGMYTYIQSCLLSALPLVGGGGGGRREGFPAPVSFTFDGHLHKLSSFVSLLTALCFVFCLFFSFSCFGKTQEAGHPVYGTFTLLTGSSCVAQRFNFLFESSILLPSYDDGGYWKSGRDGDALILIRRFNWSCSCG